MCVCEARRKERSRMWFKQAGVWMRGWDVLKKKNARNCVQRQNGGSSEEEWKIRKKRGNSSSRLVWWSRIFDIDYGDLRICQVAHQWIFSVGS